jgi:hypothetical protein
MSNTPALTAEYRKVIAGKFVTKRDGSPMRCVTCSEPLQMGRTFAATNGDGWVSYCADCSTTMAAQVRGLVSKLTEMDVTIPDAMRTMVISFVQNETVPMFLACKAALMGLRSEAGKAARAATVCDGIDLTVLPGGCYAVPGGDTRLKLKIDVVTKGKWAGWVFVKDAAAYGQGQRYGSQKPGQRYSGKVTAELAAIIADPAGAMHAYGQITGQCCFCALPLEKTESVARGYGPTCADNHGLPFDHAAYNAEKA